MIVTFPELPALIRSSHSPVSHLSDSQARLPSLTRLRSPKSFRPGLRSLSTLADLGLHTSSFGWLVQRKKERTPLARPYTSTLLSDMDAYTFPDNRLKKKMQDPSKTPLCLIACGSFSPVTFLHLRMFTMVQDYVKFSTDFEIVGGYFSPVSDAYKKAGLATAEHR